MSTGKGAHTDPVLQARGHFIAMAATYGLGVFNDSFFRTAVILLAIAKWDEGMEGWVMVTFNLPYVLFAAWAGWLADRISKRHVVISSKIMELAAMILGGIGLLFMCWPLMFAMVFLMGLQSCIFNPALNGSIPELYPDYFVNRANARLKVVTTALILAGIGITGPVKSLDLGMVYIAVTIMVISVTGLITSFLVPLRPAANKNAGFPWGGPIETIGELVRTAKDRLLATVIVVNVFIWFAGAMLILIIPVFAQKFMGCSESNATLLIAAEAGGVAIGGVIGGRLSHGKDCLRLFYPALLGFAICIAIFPCVIMLPSTVKIITAYIILIYAGVCGGICVVPSGSFVQMRPAPQCKGTVIASVSFAIFTAMILAGIIEWTIIQFLSSAHIFVILSICAFILALWLKHRVRTLALEGELDD